MSKATIFSQIRAVRYRRIKEMVGREVRLDPIYYSKKYELSGKLLKVYTEHGKQYAVVNVHNMVGDPQREMHLLIEGYRFTLDPER